MEAIIDPNPAAPGSVYCTVMSSDAAPPILALDSGSPTVSVAVAGGGRTLAARQVEIGRSSQRLLPMIDEALDEAGVRPRELAGIVALAGPGSFTGLRVGLATAMGLHQALGVPATAVPTLGALAAAVSRTAVPLNGDGPRRAVAVVDVLRGEWAAQEFRVRDDAPPEPLAAAERLPQEELVTRLAAADAEPAWLVGFGIGALETALAAAVTAGRVRPCEPPGLAQETARLATEHPPAWNPVSLTEPLYFRPPAVTLPKRRRGGGDRRGC